MELSQIGLIQAESAKLLGLQPTISRKINSEHLMHALSPSEDFVESNWNFVYNPLSILWANIGLRSIYAGDVCDKHYYLEISADHKNSEPANKIWTAATVTCLGDRHGTRAEGKVNARVLNSSALFGVGQFSLHAYMHAVTAYLPFIWHL